MSDPIGIPDPFILHLGAISCKLEMMKDYKRYFPLPEIQKETLDKVLALLPEEARNFFLTHEAAAKRRDVTIPQSELVLLTAIQMEVLSAKSRIDPLTWKRVQAQ